MKIPDDMLLLLAQDSEFFAQMMGCGDVTTTLADTDGGLDVQEPDPDNADAVALLPEEEQMGAMAYYFMNHIDSERRCLILCKLALPCVREMRELFEQKRLKGDGLDIAHFMPQFPIDARGHIVDSPWGPWFAQWCGSEPLCNTHKTLLKRMGHRVDRFTIQSVSAPIHSDDLVLARHNLRVNEERAEIKRYLTKNRWPYVRRMDAQKARRVIDFLLEEWMYAGVLANPAADVTQLTSDFWFLNQDRLVMDDRFLPELMQLLAQDRYRVTDRSIQLSVMCRQVQCLTALMQHDTIASLGDVQIIRGLFNGFRCRRGQVRFIDLDVLDKLLRVVYEAQPAALIGLSRTVGDHHTIGFCNWMEAHTTVNSDELRVVHRNSSAIRKCRTRTESRAVVGRYHADGEHAFSAMDGVVALHDALGRARSVTEYENGRRNRIAPIAGLEESEWNMTVDELRQNRGDDFEPSLSMLFWMQPTTDAERAWMHLFGLVGPYDGLSTMLVLSNHWHARTGARIGGIVDFMDRELVEMGMCPLRIIGLFLLREFAHDFRMNPVARLHALGLISEEDQPGLAGLLVAPPAR
ncbi:MAG: hypothetical protein JKX76_02760 [Colwellia sp.]|nr:hypothetical protein [Colwellia sp.]